MNNIRFCAVYYFGNKAGQTHIITKQGKKYIFNSEDCYKTTNKMFEEFISRALKYRCVVNMGLGNRLYYRDYDKELIKHIIRRYKNNEYPLLEIYKHWEEYI